MLTVIFGDGAAVPEQAGPFPIQETEHRPGGSQTACLSTNTGARIAAHGSVCCGGWAKPMPRSLARSVQATPPHGHSHFLRRPVVPRRVKRGRCPEVGGVARAHPTIAARAGTTNPPPRCYYIRQPIPVVRQVLTGISSPDWQNSPGNIAQEQKATCLHKGGFVIIVFRLW